MEENLNNNISPNYYKTNDFLKDLKNISSKNNQPKKYLTQNIKTEAQDTKIEQRNKLNIKLNFLGQVPNTYYNEVMASELKNLSRENSELKFCLDKLNKKFEKEIKELKLQNSNKVKEITSSKEVIKKNIELIELLGDKISKYEKIFKDMENKTKQKKDIDKNIKEKLIKLENENAQLLIQIKKRDEIIKGFNQEMDSKKEIFEEIDKMKSEMESNLKTMDSLYLEIKEKDEEINKLKQLLELMNIKQKQDIEKINKENENKNSANAKEMNNDDLIKELEKSKEKQKNLENELNETKKNYNIAKEYNNKMQELTKEASQMIKNSIDSRDKMKEEYDKAIKELIEKYEKQIQFLKVVIVEQNEKYEKQMEELNKEKNKDIKDNNKDTKEENNQVKDKSVNDKEEEEKNKYLEKLKNDNVMLINQNSELKHMNEMLLSKMKDLPELNNRFNELFETVKLLKEENDLLKKQMKGSKIMQMLEQDQDKDNENEEEIEEKVSNNKTDNLKEIYNGQEGQKLNDEELQVLESILKDIETGEDKKAEYDVNKLQILENILKKLENKNEEENNNEDSKENENEEEKNKEDENNNDNINDEELNMKNKLLLEAMLQSLGGEDNINNNKDLKQKPINEINKKEIQNDSNNKAYNKKILKSSPISINKNSGKKNEQNDPNKTNKLNLVKKNLYPNSEENEEIEDEEEENTPNDININFNLYKPKKEGMLRFNLSKKIYSIKTPLNYDEFLKVFDPETSVQYNTLEGLFIIPSNKTNQIFYYSSLKNVISDLFMFKENHSGGCLFLDNSTKNILAIGGDNSKKVEKFWLETAKHEQLPELPEFISNMTCIQIGNKIYSFFGVIKEREESPILCLDLDNKDGKWEYINFENKAEFKILSGMSCINLNDNELLIIGGITDNNIPNDKLLYFNLDKKELLKLDKSLPESEDKKFIFTQNTQFNLFINGDSILYANIDNKNQVHIIDNDLHYDLYLNPSEL